MEEKDKSEQIIGKLIKKRKQENDAFLKLLNALDSRGNSMPLLSKSTKKKN